MEQDQETLNLRIERASKLIKEAVGAANIKDYSQYKGTPAYFARYWRIEPEDSQTLAESPQQRWDVYKADRADDVILMIQLNKFERLAWFETSLFGTAIDLITGAEKILDAHDAARIFKIESAVDREEAIDFNVRAALVSYINYLPLMLTRALDTAFDDSIERQVRISIQPTMREHWQLIGLPQDFAVLSNWDRDSLVGEIDKYRKVFTGRMKQPLPESLPLIYQSLRLRYRTARKYHNDTRKVFLASNDEARWNAYWETNCVQMFPDLSYDCLMTLRDQGHQKNAVTPAELALKHLSVSYARSPEYMRKQVSLFAVVAKDKAKRDKKKN